MFTPARVEKPFCRARQTHVKLVGRKQKPENAFCAQLYKNPESAFASLSTLASCHSLLSSLESC